MSSLVDGDERQPTKSFSLWSFLKKDIVAVFFKTAILSFTNRQKAMMTWNLCNKIMRSCKC